MSQSLEPTPQDLQRNLRGDYLEVRGFMARDATEPAFSIVASELLAMHYPAAARRALAAEAALSRVRAILGAWMPADGNCRACGGSRQSGHKGACAVRELERALAGR
jgi:hypothetical protein